MSVLALVAGCTLSTASADVGATAPPDSTTGPAAPGKRASAPVRFVAIGDAGTGDETQFAVAGAVEAVCAVRGCDFALYLGDNFYSDGVDSADDDQFIEKFEEPYAYIDFPFYVALGNHDYGGGGSGNEFEKPDHQVEYARANSQFVLPDRYYSFTAGVVDFWALDTNAIIWGQGDTQQQWVTDTLAESTASWKIAYGHHPYHSNGPHGNVGKYDGSDGNGDSLKWFMDESVCGNVDVYLCGHDHSLQWLEPGCGTELIVSGAGGKTSNLEGDNPSFFEEETPGFVWIEIDGDTLVGEVYDEEAELLFTRTVTR